MSGLKEPWINFLGLAELAAEKGAQSRVNRWGARTGRHMMGTQGN
jgi:hypothetical protein